MTFAFAMSTGGVGTVLPSVTCRLARFEVMCCVARRHLRGSFRLRQSVAGCTTESNRKRLPSQEVEGRTNETKKRMATLRAFIRAGRLLGPSAMEGKWVQGRPELSPSLRRNIDSWIDEQSPSLIASNEENTRWWSVFNDPNLEELVQVAYQQNLTLRAAGLRVLQARTQRDISALNLLPQSQAMTGSYSRNQISRNGPQHISRHQFFLRQLAHRF